MIARLAYAVIAAVASIPLAVMTEGLSFQYGKFPTPGAYVWGLLNRDTYCGFLGCVGSLFGTMLAIDSSCWFIVLCLMGFVIERSLGKRKKPPTQV